MTIKTERLVYSVDETSKMLGISRNLCYRLCRQKKLPVLFLGKRMLCPAQAIHRLLEGQPEES